MVATGFSSVCLSPDMTLTVIHESGSGNGGHILSDKDIKEQTISRYVEAGDTRSFESGSVKALLVRLVATSLKVWRSFFAGESWGRSWALTNVFLSHYVHSYSYNKVLK